MTSKNGQAAPMDKPDPILSNKLTCDAATHGFYTRQGGISTGVFRD